MADKPTVANAWRTARPALSDDLRLLLLFSRISLDPGQRDRAVELGDRIQDWDAFARKAAEHFLAPLCLYHLARLDPTPFLTTARASLMRKVMPMAMQTLRMASVQRQFVERHVNPLVTQFSVIKGRALAARYYPEAGLRYARDLDVLVPAERIPELVLLAQNDGYRVYPERRELTLEEAHILTRQSRVVTLIGPEGIQIEVHTQLDKAGFLLDHRAILGRTELIDIDGVTTQVLSTTDHFVYICLHHSKHFWSRLNWLADLDALIRSPDFDEAAVLTLARERGVERTITACIGLHRACEAEEPWREAKRSSEVLDLLRACLVILEEGADKEFEMRPDRLSMDFNFEWQIPPGFRRRLRWRGYRQSLLPSVRDFQTLALPRALYWLYVPLRPALIMARKLGR